MNLIRATSANQVKNYSTENNGAIKAFNRLALMPATTAKR
jgi:hypothetical protein